MPVPFVSYFRHIYFKAGPFSYREGPLEKLWGGGGRGVGDFRAAGIFFVFLGQSMNIFNDNWHTWISFHLIFPCANIFLVLRLPWAPLINCYLIWILCIYLIQIYDKFIKVVWCQPGIRLGMPSLVSRWHQTTLIYYTTL